MNKLKTPLIIFFLILLTFSFLKVPEYFFEKSNLRILETKENLTYNYNSETISPSQLAELFCSGELEEHFSLVANKFNSEFDRESVYKKTDLLLKNLFKGYYSSLYSFFSDIISETITDYGERTVFIKNSLGKPIALNFVSVTFVKDKTHFAVFFEEKTQTVFLMEYISSSVKDDQNYEDTLSIAFELNSFFESYFRNDLNTSFYNVNSSLNKDFIYCINTLEGAKSEY